MQDQRTLSSARALASREEPLAPVAQPQLGLKEIPYDHVATFPLRGERAGDRVEDVINISVDGAFVATAVGYSFIPAPLPSDGVDIVKIQQMVATLPPRTSTLLNVFGALFTGFVGDPSLAIQCLLLRLCGIDFLYSIIDSGTGRELQNRSIHNIAGLGSPDGRRPFRPLATPMLFMPRSTIRIVVEEISVGPLYRDARLFIVLHGYKILGYGV
jgi:hypothetical protein